MESMNDAFPLPDPRVQGVREHWSRANWFIQGAVQQDASSFRLFLTSAYSCRACVEIMLEAVAEGQHPAFQQPDPKTRRDEFEKTIISRLPRYSLIEAIRIHDFHRFGLVPPDPRMKTFFGGGPIKLSGNKGAAVLQEAPTGPQRITSGNSRIKEQRALRVQDGNFYDDDSGQYVPLRTVVIDFLSALPPVLDQFEAALGTRTANDSQEGDQTEAPT